MATGSLQINRDIILATKRQQIKEHRSHTPVEAALAIAQMQRRPRSFLNYASDNEHIALVAQITRTERYDPVTSALHCLHNGAAAISFFTDHSIYHEDLDDVMMVARGVNNIPVIYQNYIFDEYGVMLARGADASAMVLYSYVLDEADLRRSASMAQRWKMSTMIQVNAPEEIDFALTLSPHALCFGDVDANLEQTVADLQGIRQKLPTHVSVMLMQTLYSVEEIEHALTAEVDALIISEDVLKHEHSVYKIKKLIAAAEAQRRND